VNYVPFEMLRKSRGILKSDEINRRKINFTYGVGRM
jgi:hypothetical protein